MVSSSCMHMYRLFDLTVQSDIPIEEAVLLNPDSQADVTVKLGEISFNPHKYPNTLYYGEDQEWWSCLRERNWLLFNTPVGIFEIRDGARITVCPNTDADMLSLRTYLLGSAFGTLQIQRNLFPIHGGSIAVNGKALIFAGEMGAGKSTTVDALVCRDYRYLSDDISTIMVESGLPKVLPAYPQRKLCRDACVARGYALQNLVLISEERDKYAIRRADEWQDNRLPLGWIVEIVPTDDKIAHICQVNGHEKIHFLITNLYRSYIHSMRRIEPLEMKQLLTIAANADMYRIFRPQGMKSMPATLELLFCRLGEELMPA